MADYWKSNAKKFCQICKTWYADNKISIENHERGTKHKAMVQQRLREGAQKAQRKEREQAELQNTLRQMEQAALASMAGYSTTNEPSTSAADPVGLKPLSKIERERLVFKEQQRKLAELKRTAAHSQFWDGGEENSAPDSNEPLPPSSAVLDRQWVEAQHESGHLYYWHISTGETRWKQPPEGFYTAAEYSAKYMQIMANAVSFSAALAVADKSATPAVAFTAMPQSSLAGTDPFAVDNRKDRRRQKTGEKRRADDDEEKPSRDVLRLSEESQRPPVKMGLKVDEAGNGPMDSRTADLPPVPEPINSEPCEIVTVKAKVSEKEEETRRPTSVGTAAADDRPPRPAHPLGQWVPVVKKDKQIRVVADLPAQTVKRKAADIVAEMEMDPHELQFQEKVLDSTTSKKSSKAAQFKKRSTTANKANMRQRID